jgi:hypothetical protein
MTQSLIVGHQLPLLEGAVKYPALWRKEWEVMSVPEVVRELAREKGWSLPELARRCDIPVDSVRNLVYGKSVNPTLDTVVKLARGTGKSPMDIMEMLGYSKVVV